MIRECWGEEATVYSIEEDSQVKVCEGLLELARQAERLDKLMRIADFTLHPLTDGDFVATVILS